MAMSSRLAVPALFAFLVASTGCSGCSDDPAPAPPPTSGKGGTGGNGGTGIGGKGGAGPTGGTGGTNAGGTSSGGTNAGGSSGSGAGTACGAPNGSGTLTGAKPVALGDAKLPFDATPSPDGCTVYFTALDATDTPSVYKSSGGTATRLTGGGLLTLPSGITVNSTGGTLFVADPEAEPTPGQFGALFAIPASGGGAEVLTGTAGKRVSGVTVARLAGTDVLYFTGQEADGKGAVYSIPIGGGAATTVFVGPPLVSPSSVAVTDDGTVYVTDNGGGGALYAVKGVTATLIKAPLSGGFPSGVALSRDGTAVLLAAASGATRIDRVGLTDFKTTSFTTGLETGRDPAGLHRALSVEVYALVDQVTGGAGGIFLLAP